MLELGASLALAIIVAGPNLYRFFLVLPFLTEFYYVEVGSGFARIHHFVSILVVVALTRHVPRLLRARTTLALLVFVGVNIIALLFSDDPLRASTSFLGFSANLAVATAFALILVSGRLDIDDLERLIIRVSLVSIAWGLVQIVAYRLGGVNLALSPQQEIQVAAGFGPGFRTEANTFGKFLVLPFFVLLPRFLERGGRREAALFAAVLTGTLMNFTRSAVFGIAFGVCAVVVWYSLRGRSRLVLRRAGLLAIPLGVVIALGVGGSLGLSDYAQHKLENLFSREELLEGGSSAHRIRMMELVVDTTLASARKSAIGNGWGQTHTYLNNVEVQAGGGDAVNVLGYCGLVGVLSYLGYMLAAFTAARRAALGSRDPRRLQLAEGVMFAFLGIGFTAQLSGYLIAPEYWLVIGMCVYLESTLREVRLEPVRGRS